MAAAKKRDEDVIGEISFGSINQRKLKISADGWRENTAEAKARRRVV
jgi:hypothetical protein